MFIDKGRKLVSSFELVLIVFILYNLKHLIKLYNKMSSIQVSSSSNPLLFKPHSGQSIEIQKNIKSLIDSVLHCPKVIALATKAVSQGDPLHGRTGTITIIYDPKTCVKMVGHPNHGFTDHTQRCIILGTLDKVKGLGILIFEIGNTAQTPEYRNLQSQALRRGISSDEYAKQVSRIEYQSGLWHHEIVSWGMNHLSWNVNLDTHGYLHNVSFEKIWLESRTSQKSMLDRQQYEMLLKLQPQNLVKKVSQNITSSTSPPKKFPFKKINYIIGKIAQIPSGFIWRYNEDNNNIKISVKLEDEGNLNLIRDFLISNNLRKENGDFRKLKISGLKSGFQLEISKSSIKKLR